MKTFTVGYAEHTVKTLTCSLDENFTQSRQARQVLVFFRFASLRLCVKQTLIFKGIYH